MNMTEFSAHWNYFLGLGLFLSVFVFVILNIKNGFHSILFGLEIFLSVFVCVIRILKICFQMDKLLSCFTLILLCFGFDVIFM